MMLDVIRWGPHVSVLLAQDISIATHGMEVAAATYCVLQRFMHPVRVWSNNPPAYSAGCATLPTEEHAEGPDSPPNTAPMQQHGTPISAATVVPATMSFPVPCGAMPFMFQPIPPPPTTPPAPTGPPQAAPTAAPTAFTLEGSLPPTVPASVPNSAPAQVPHEVPVLTPVLTPVLHPMRTPPPPPYDELPSVPSLPSHLPSGGQRPGLGRTVLDLEAELMQQSSGGGSRATSSGSEDLSASPSLGSVEREKHGNAEPRHGHAGHAGHAGRPKGAGKGGDKGKNKGKANGNKGKRRGGEAWLGAASRTRCLRSCACVVVCLYATLMTMAPQRELMSIAYKVYKFLISGARWGDNRNWNQQDWPGPWWGFYPAGYGDMGYWGWGDFHEYDYPQPRARDREGGNRNRDARAPKPAVEKPAGQPSSSPPAAWRDSAFGVVGFYRHFFA